MLHKITINGCKDAAELSKYHGLKKSMYEVGETVTFFILIATDTSYSVTSAQVSTFSAEGTLNGTRTYSFIMPDTDVEINVSARSTMMNPYMNGGTMPTMGMMALGNGPMNISSAAPVSQNTAPDPYPWEGKPKFCAECGTPTKGADRVCKACGAPLLPQK